MSYTVSRAALSRAARIVITATLALALVASADGRVSAELSTRADGSLDLAVALDGRPVLDAVRLGLVTESADLSSGLMFESARHGRFDQEYERNYEGKPQHPGWWNWAPDIDVIEVAQ